MESDESRRKTLLLLLDLARTSDPASCWDQERAESILRNQSTEDELRELGADPLILERIFKSNG